MLSFITLFLLNVLANLFELKINYFILTLKQRRQLALEQPAMSMVASAQVRPVVPRTRWWWGGSNPTVFLSEVGSSNSLKGVGHRSPSALFLTCGRVA